MSYAMLDIKEAMAISWFKQHFVCFLIFMCISKLIHFYIVSKKINVYIFLMYTFSK